MKGKVMKVIGGVAIIVLIVAFGILIANKPTEKAKPAKIIATNFVGYDFARAITGDGADVAMLLSPGAEMHNFEPTPEDIIRIKNADLFIYNGGESDEWVEKVLKDNEIPEEKTLKMMDLVDLKEEDNPEGMDDTSKEEGEYDEHIWTSPVNAKLLVSGIREKLAEIYPEGEEVFLRNYTEYTKQLDELDQEFREVVARGGRKVLIFGDRFPFRYFVDEYGLDYYAAFPGCAEQTEASSGTIAFLINKAREEGVRVILKTELTSSKLARTIAEETGAKVMELYAMHNVSQDDFDSGVTYVDMMRKNVQTLEEALK